MRRIRKPKRRGFTLIALLIVVAIIGVLAAVAIPVFSSYLMRSKASEAHTILQGIREKEEAYFGEYRQYTETIALRPGGAACGDCINETRSWTLDDASPEANKWIQLGFDPGGQTYYAYEVDSPYDANGIFQNANFADYAVPSIKDRIPTATIAIEDPNPTGPYGAKGTGEPPVAAAAAVFANAIADALGVRFTKLPITREDILEAVRKGNDD